MSTNQDKIIKTQNYLKNLEYQQNLQNKIIQTKKYLNKLKSKKHNISKSAYKTEAKQSSTSTDNNSTAGASNVDKADNTNTESQNSAVHHQAKRKGPENVFHTLLALGLPKDNGSFCKNKKMRSVSEIINILKQYNTVQFTIDTMNGVQDPYRVVNLSSKSQPDHFDIVYHDNTNGATEPVRTDWGIQYAKRDIEHQLWYRMMNMSYFTYDLQNMPFYDTLPEPLKKAPHAGPAILAWLLHHYGFDLITNRILHSTHGLWSRCFSPMSPLKIRYTNIDGTVYPYFSSTKSIQPAHLDTGDSPNAYAYFDISDLMGVTDVPSPAGKDCGCDDDEDDDDCC